MNGKVFMISQFPLTNDITPNLPMESVFVYTLASAVLGDFLVAAVGQVREVIPSFEKPS